MLFCLLVLVNIAAAQFLNGPEGFADSPGQGFNIGGQGQNYNGGLNQGFNGGLGEGFNNGGPGQNFNNGAGQNINNGPVQTFNNGFNYNNQNNQVLYDTKGRLTCGITPLNNVQVVLWDRENGIYQQAQTDAIGTFHLQAKSNNQQLIHPLLTISHDCNDEKIPGLRRMTVKLPSEYTNQGQYALKTFDIGTWNLETIFSGEESDKPNRHPVNFGGYFHHNFGNLQRGNIQV